MNVFNYIFNKLRAFYQPIKYCRSLGAKIGDNCKIRASMLSTEPWLITIGNHVLLADGVKLITHDGAVWCLNENNKYDIWGEIVIGNNVYVGVNTLILPNVHITDNVIIGAGSVITKDITESGVYVGCPARMIKTFDEWKNNTKGKRFETTNLSTEEKRKRYFDIMNKKKTSGNKGDLNE